MGKYLTSLLILSSSLLLPNEIHADEKVRRVQEELRKRHLFYAEANGEKGAALTIAVRRYQEKKGFSPTGVIDSVTLASLGIPTAAPLAATTPVVVGKRGQVHGANGESLPNDPPVLWPRDERVGQLASGIIDREYIDLALTDFQPHGMQRPRTSGNRVRLTNFTDQRAAAFDAPGQWILHSMANPVWSPLVWPPAADVSGEFAIDDERVHQVTIKPDRRSHRRPRRVRPRKETNPFVLTYQSVDRAIRSVFGDTQTKKKRSVARRL